MFVKKLNENVLKAIEQMYSFVVEGFSDRADKKVDGFEVTVYSLKDKAGTIRIDIKTKGGYGE